MSPVEYGTTGGSVSGGTADYSAESYYRKLQATDRMLKAARKSNAFLRGEVERLEKTLGVERERNHLLEKQSVDARAALADATRTALAAGGGLAVPLARLEKAHYDLSGRLDKLAAAHDELVGRLRVAVAVDPDA